MLVLKNAAYYVIVPALWMFKTCILCCFLESTPLQLFIFPLWTNATMQLFFSWNCSRCLGSLAMSSLTATVTLTVRLSRTVINSWRRESAVFYVWLYIATFWNVTPMSWTMTYCIKLKVTINMSKWNIKVLTLLATQNGVRVSETWYKNILSSQ